MIYKRKIDLSYVTHILQAVGEYQTSELFFIECFLPFLIIDSYADTVCLDVLDEGSENETCCFSVHLVH
jgi:hypothetical protein